MKSATRTTALLLALIFCHAALLAWSAGSSSVTFDEYAHLPAGCAYWKHRAFSIYNLSPPLLRMWAALPAVLAGANVPDPAPVLGQSLTERHWTYAQMFLDVNRANYQRLFVIGRLAMIPISCVGLWIVWKWARQLYGDRAALAAGALYAFNPDLIAHGSIVGTDSGTAVAMLAAIWTWWMFCRAPSFRRGATAAILVALAHLCKFSALLLWPMMVATAACVLASNPARWRAVLGALGATLGVTWLTINLMYGFSGSFRPIREYSARSSTLQATIASNVPVPLPYDFFSGFDTQKWETEQQYPAYLLGETYRGTRWNYYPVVLACKLPVGAIVLIALALVSVFVGGSFFRKPFAEEFAPLAAMLTFIVGILFLANINIGARYILPVYPFAIILMARLWSDESSHRIWSVVRWSLVGVASIESLVVAPRFLSFINLAAGGPGNGWKIVTDSNLDWGQSLIELKKWMDAHEQSRVCLVYFGRVDPAVYGIDYSTVTAPRDEKYVVVSSYFLVGLGQRVRTPTGLSPFLDLPYAPELRKKMPVAQIGNTLFVFERKQVVEAAAEAKTRLARERG